MGFIAMMMSILSNKPECYVCGARHNLHRHHCIYGSANRRLSDADGLWIYLCPYHHNMSDHGVHFDKKLDERIKQDAQNAWEERYGNREAFIKRYGKSYL